MEKPCKGDIWMVNLDSVREHEQSGTRPALIISVDLFNHGPADLVVVLPITSRNKGIPFHVEINPPEGGLNYKSFIKCEDIRSISKCRLSQKLGSISNQTMYEVEDRLRILLNL